MRLSSIDRLQALGTSPTLPEHCPSEHWASNIECGSLLQHPRIFRMIRHHANRHGTNTCRPSVCLGCHQQTESKSWPTSFHVGLEWIISFEVWGKQSPNVAPEYETRHKECLE